jgi:hypothetical protein
VLSEEGVIENGEVAPENGESSTDLNGNDGDDTTNPSENSSEGEDLAQS